MSDITRKAIYSDRGYRQRFMFDDRKPLYDCLCYVVFLLILYKGNSAFLTDNLYWNQGKDFFCYQNMHNSSVEK
jgi:hypothetical protein